MSSKNQASQGYGSISQEEGAPTPAAAPATITLKSALIAEVFGTCILVQIGCAINCVALYTGTSTGIGAVALVWGTALAVAVYCTAAFSGGHLNPAVTLGFALVRPGDFNASKVIPYWIAQFVGAISATAINLFLFWTSIQHYETKNGIVRGASVDSIASAAAFGNYAITLNDKNAGSAIHVCLIEAFGTAVLVFTIFLLTHTKNPIPAPAVPAIIGGIFGILVATLVPLTGAGLNPARDFGPRLVVAAAHWGRFAFTDCVPYLVGPLLGGPIGALIADKLFMMD